MKQDKKVLVTIVIKDKNGNPKFTFEFKHVRPTVEKFFKWLAKIKWFGTRLTMTIDLYIGVAQGSPALVLPLGTTPEQQEKLLATIEGQLNRTFNNVLLAYQTDDGTLRGSNRLRAGRERRRGGVA